MTIGQRIKKMRTEMGLSQAKLSEKVGVDRSLISQLESDKGTGTSHVAALAYALKVNALWLQTGKGKPDVGYTPPIEVTKSYCKEIEAVIELMNSTDNRGREKVLIAVKDTIDAHKAWKSLHRIREADEIDQYGNQLGQIATELADSRMEELLPEIFEDVKRMKEETISPINDVYISDKKKANDPKDKRH